MNMKEIQESVKIIRNVLGCTQTELANVLGITRQHLGKIESGAVELQQTIAIAFIATVIETSKGLDRDSITYKVISVYVDEFQNIIRKIVYLGEGI